MLQRIGDSVKNSKVLAYVILLPLILVFAAWGAYGVVNMDFAGVGDNAAKVNGIEITRQRVTEAWSQQQSAWQQRFGGDIPAEEQKRLQDNLLESFIRNALLKERSNETGYRISRARLDEFIRNYPAFQVEGQYNEARALAVLANEGISQEQFTADLRADLQNQELQRAIEISNFLTPAETQRRLALEDEQRQVAVLRFPAEKFAAAAPDEATLAQWHAEHPTDYQTLESVKLNYAELFQQQMANKVVVTESDLRDLYEKNRDRYVEPERRRARHVLIAAARGDDAAARAKAQKIATDLKAGADFAELARVNSADSQSAAQGGDLGWAERATFVPEFAKAVFEQLKPGEISAPVKTQFGYHVIRLDEIQAGRARSFEDARADLEAEYRNSESANQFGDTQERIAERLESGGVALADLAKEFGLATGSVDEFVRGVGGGALGANPDLESEVFSTRSLEQRRIVGPVVLGDDRLVIVQVQEHRKPKLRPLAEVRDAVIAAVRKDQGSKAAKAAADVALARLAAGESLAAVAKTFGLTAEEPRFVGRADPSLTAEIRAAVFAGNRPTKAPVRGALTLDAGGAALYEVLSSKRDPNSANAELAKQRLSEALSRGGAGDVSAYVAELRRVAKVEKNPDAFE